MSRAMLARKAEAAPAAPLKTAAKSSASELRIGEPDDAFEQEADRVADAILLGNRDRPKWSLSRMSIDAPLQRKCACDGPASAAGECEDCKEKKSLQRKATGAPQSSVAPPIVHDVLRTSGKTLDAGSRKFFERRFQHDFSNVRVHADDKAALSAKSVHARAYTVGHHIVFGSRGYAPDSEEGRHLLAHELTHVVQQGAARSRDGRVISGPDAELGEARGSHGVLATASGGLMPTMQRSGPLLQRNGGEIELGLEPTPRDEQKRLKELGINLPEVSLQTWQKLTSHVGRTLDTAERQKITQITNAQPPMKSSTPPEGTLNFVLHDTEDAKGKMGRGELNRRAGLARGPLGEEGTAAYIPDTGSAVPSYGLFESRRPTSTEFERANNLMKQKDRESGYRQIWHAASRAARSSALQSALDGLPLSQVEQKRERANAENDLNASSGAVHTTASWVADEICRQFGATAAGPPAFAPELRGVAGGKADSSELTVACAIMSPVFKARRDRVASQVNVEIVQSSGNLKPNKDTQSPYTANQYEQVKYTYLQAALAAGRYPYITTHWLIDRDSGDHYDPRCFDVDHLYSLIATAMGHHPASTYGIIPHYGTDSSRGSKDNVWWDKNVCGGPPPNTSK